ncbi:DoxX family protein [Marinitenerispora sediminis]|uniref:DoxX family protein n=1 Tax=Marinitenerispora sediminis TaxID=1931232 RepID=UPI000DF340E3|nr:DoxX family protein [Marinitenerispora sediminis]RCV54987.1 DoxX family protein [Marinitenerispora sediminis]RCV59977.1 DoxX family protein [Marinitenerispora sediminis]
MAGQTLTTKYRLADTATLIARIAIGVIFIAHGWQKIGSGVDAVAGGFAALGIPLPQLAAIVAIVVEFGGGILLLVGFALPVTGTVLALQMLAAYGFAHFGTPLIGEGGFELVLALAVSSLALGFTGGGFAVDRLLPWGRDREGARPVRVA